MELIIFDTFRLNESDVIQLIGILVSLLTSLIAIIISIITLRQNSKMIAETTRPSIQIYPVYTNSILYIVIKNFGASEAYVDEITCNHNFTSEETLGDFLGANIFARLQGSMLSPGYSIKCPLDACSMANKTFKFHIRYHSATKKYENTFSFTPITNAPFADLYPDAHTTEGHLRNISKELRDIVKSKL